jgi:hypothetical protein
MLRRVVLSWIVVCGAILATACGTTTPTSSSRSGSVGIQGVVLGNGSGVAPPTASSAGKVAAGTGQITVTIDGTGITTTVSANGTFELTGVPGGTFTLVFQSNGVEIGRVVITAGAGSEVKIVVQLQNTTMIVVQLEVDEAASPSPEPSPTASPSSGTGSCAIAGGKLGSGIELEGNVTAGSATAFTMAVNGERSSASVDVSASAANFKCNGKKDGDTACKASLAAGAQVHVRGTLMTCDTSKTEVTATEVMVQKGASGD